MIGIDWILLLSGVYSSWVCIVSKLIFDWVFITFWLKWGSIQKWDWCTSINWKMIGKRIDAWNALPDLVCCINPCSNICTNAVLIRYRVQNWWCWSDRVACINNSQMLHQSWNQLCSKQTGPFLCLPCSRQALIGLSGLEGFLSAAKWCLSVCKRLAIAVTSFLLGHPPN